MNSLKIQWDYLLHIISYHQCVWESKPRLLCMNHQILVTITKLRNQGINSNQIIPQQLNSKINRIWIFNEGISLTLYQAPLYVLNKKQHSWCMIWSVLSRGPAAEARLVNCSMRRLFSRSRPHTSSLILNKLSFYDQSVRLLVDWLFGRLIDQKSYTYMLPFKYLL